MKLNEEIISRIYFYTKLGWGNYIAWWLGAIAYITIIYALILKAFLPANPLTYILIFMAIMILSLLMGYTMCRKGVYGIESKINTEANPYIHILIGKKEILGYQNSIAGMEREITNYEVQLAILEKLGLGDKSDIIKRNIESTKEYKKRLEAMLANAIDSK